VAAGFVSLLVVRFSHNNINRACGPAAGGSSFELEAKPSLPEERSPCLSSFCRAFGHVIVAE
jgi:hypothetical protein